MTVVDKNNKNVAKLIREAKIRRSFCFIRPPNFYGSILSFTKAATRSLEITLIYEGHKFEMVPGRG